MNNGTLPSFNEINAAINRYERTGDRSILFGNSGISVDNVLTQNDDNDTLQAEADRLEQVIAELAAKPIVPLTEEELAQRPYLPPLQAVIVADRREDYVNPFEELNGRYPSWNPNYRSQRGY